MRATESLRARDREPYAIWDARARRSSGQPLRSPEISRPDVGNLLRAALLDEDLADALLGEEVGQRYWRLNTSSRAGTRSTRQVWETP